jgi:small subunit ribosomal protein S20
MPTTKSAKKAFKVSEKKRSRNRHFLALLKESVKAFEAVQKAEKKDQKKVAEALSLVYSRLDTLEKKNIIHKNNAARKKSSFAKIAQSLTA